MPLKCYLVVIVLNLSWPFTTFAGSEGYGTVSVVKGKANILSAKTQAQSPAHIGDRVFPGDVVITDADSRVKITMMDTNVLNVSPSTRMTIDHYENNNEKKKVLLSIDFGKVRSTVNQKYDGELNTYQVKTPTAVAGVRGTDFLVSFDQQSGASRVITFRGQVEVGPKLDQVSGHITGVTVRVKPGQETLANPSQAPTAPTPVPPQELNSILRDSSADTTNATSGNGKVSANSKTSSRAPASIASPGTTALTSADLANTESGSGDLSRNPASSLASTLIPSAPLLGPPPLVSPDLVKSGNSKLTINVK